jgi:hypothetical protein
MQRDASLRPSADERAKGIFVFFEELEGITEDDEDVSEAHGKEERGGPRAGCLGRRSG